MRHLDLSLIERSGKPAERMLDRLLLPRSFDPLLQDRTKRSEEHSSFKVAGVINRISLNDPANFLEYVRISRSCIE